MEDLNLKILNQEETINNNKAKDKTYRSSRKESSNQKKTYLSF